ncbi:helix-turn-helix transcriptional regulator [bacterium]|nr:helix-turn-helix transcriptional regulator [bacterium]
MATKAFEATDFDVRLGRAIKIARLKMGRSQKEVASGTGITFQQIQKYEAGGNRVSVSRLRDICKFLEVGMSDIVKEAEGNHLYSKKMAKLIEALYQLSPENLQTVNQVIFGMLAAQAK